MSIEDPLKPLDKLLNPDSRRSNIVGTLAEEHADLEYIRLNVDVPVIVARLHFPSHDSASRIASTVAPMGSARVCTRSISSE